MHTVRAVLLEENVVGATRRAAIVLKDPPVLYWKDTGGTIPVDRNTVGIPPRTTTQFWTGNGSSVPPNSIENQKIEGPRQSIIPKEVMKAKPLDA